jgi:hypothetical protein
MKIERDNFWEQIFIEALQGLSKGLVWGSALVFSIIVLLALVALG